MAKDLTPDVQLTLQAALGKEWKKWLQHGAARIVPPEEAHKVDRDLIVTSRAIYTDKNERARAEDPNTPWDPKARMCARGGQPWRVQARRAYSLAARSTPRLPFGRLFRLGA